MVNKYFRNKLIFFLLLGILFSIFSLNQNGQTNISLVTSAPISILSDADFVSYAFPGYGNETHPYIIENYEISTTDTIGITVSGTTKHFIVRNCAVTVETYGIFVDNVASGTAEIRENICTGNIQGIMVLSSSESTVANNTCNNNHSYGIYVFFSYDSIVANNSCSSNSYGMMINHCSDSVIANNTYVNEGLDIYDSQLTNLQTYSVYNNIANGKPIGWFKNLQDVEMNISLYNQLYLINCTRCTVAGQNMQNSLKGITLFFCTNATVYKNTLSHLGYAGVGIFVYKSVNATIEDNTISNFEHGIQISDDSNNANITDNDCSNCAFGMYVTGAGSLIQKNHISNGMYGLISAYTSNISVFANIAENNDYYGIHFRHTDYSNITNNIIRYNDNYAVYLDDGCDYNNIHHNNFVSNRQDLGSQAFDDGTNNVWFDIFTNEGNTWDDLGSGQTYLIDGSAESVDLYPMNVILIPEFQKIAILILILSLFGVTIVTLILRKKKKLV